MFKTLRALEPSPDLMERLKQEAQMLAGFDHPNIVSVVSGGITDKPAPRPYFVMERLRGRSLASIAHDTPEGAEDMVALQILIEMCDALAYIHERGVIHRDVKPDNIFLERAAQGAGSNTKLLDFGVMHVLSADKRQTSEEGMFIGTFRYAAPEQLFGKLPTPQTDLYALGLVGYETITGRHPFASCTTNEEISKAHIGTEPPPFPEADYPEGLEALIMHMLRKKPEERPKSAQWLAFQLRQIRLRVEFEEQNFASDDINQTHPSPVQNALTMTRAEATDPGEHPEEAQEQPPEPVISTAPEAPQTQWLNQAAAVERPAASFDRATEDSSEGSSLSFEEEEDDRYEESELSGWGAQRSVAAVSPGRATTSASNGAAIPNPSRRIPFEIARAVPTATAASGDSDRYRQIELRNAAAKARIRSHLRARTMAQASNAVAVSRPSIVDRLIRARGSMAAGVATSFVFVASYAYFSRRQAPVSDPLAVLTAPSASAAAPHSPTPLRAPDPPIDVPPPSAPVSPSDPASLASPFPASPPPAQPVARPSPAPPIARPSPPHTHRVMKDDLDRSLLVDDADGATKAPMRDDFVHDDLYPSPLPMPPPVARPPPARTRPVAAPMKDDFVHDPL